MNNSVYIYFDKEYNKIMTNLISSYNGIVKINEEKTNHVQKVKKVLAHLQKLKEYYVRYNISIIKKLDLLQITKIRVIFRNKLSFKNNLEQQLFKLISFILLQKLERIVKINYFYKNNLKVSKFNGVNKIVMREYIKTL